MSEGRYDIITFTFCCLNMHAGPSETTIQYIIRDQIYNASVPALSTLCLSTPPYSLLVLLEDSHQAKQHQATAMLYVHIIHLLLTYNLYIYMIVHVCLLPNKVWFDLIWFVQDMSLDINRLAAITQRSTRSGPTHIEGRPHFTVLIWVNMICLISGTGICWPLSHRVS